MGAPARPRSDNTDDYHDGFTRGDVDTTYSDVISRYSEWADVFAATSIAHAERRSPSIK